MISNIRETEDAGVVVARGSIFDLDKVIERGLAVLAVFMGHVKLAYPDMKPTIRCCNDGRWDPLTDEEYVRMQIGFITLQGNPVKGFDSGDFEYHVRADPYRIFVSLMGHDALYYRRGEDVYETAYGQSGEEYDPTPEIIVMNSTPRTVMMEKPEAEYALAAVSSVLGTTIELGCPQLQDGSAPGLLVLRFPHEHFGKGEGDIRISCTEIDE